jgi:tetratricopeptide (TPR) repeat protein
LLVSKVIGAQLTTQKSYEPRELTTDSILSLALASDLNYQHTDFLRFRSSIDQVVERFNSKNMKDSVLLAQRVYDYVQRKQLKWYKQSSSLYETFLKSEYDCLTGTTFLALVFTELGFEVKGIEFPYHMALLIELSSNQVLIDVTDPIKGFISQPSDIKKRIAYYQSESFNKLDNDYVRLIEQSKFITTDLQEIIGLLYFNQAASYYNERQYQQAESFSSKAVDLYTSERHIALLKLIRDGSRMIATN